MTNIGTSRSAVAYLIEVLVKLAESFDDAGPSRLHAGWAPKASDGGPSDGYQPAAVVATPPLPDFSRFADRFRREGLSPDSDIRAAYFESYKDGSTVYLAADEIAATISAGTEVVSAGFVTPYPPGFPILVPGQVVTSQTLEFMAALDTREIHGFDPQRGYRVFADGKPTADRPEEGVRDSHRESRTIAAIST